MVSDDTKKPDHPNRVALITNCANYLGPALCREMADKDHSLVIHDPEAGLAEELSRNGGEVEVVKPAKAAPEPGKDLHFDYDLRTAEGNARVVDAAVKRFGRLDSACFITGKIVHGPYLQSSESEWEDAKRGNLDMVFHALQAVIPAMMDAGGGQVVIITSATAARPEPGTSLYSATRAGANALVRAVGLEYAAHGISVNAVGSNFMDFPELLKVNKATSPEGRKRMEERVPMKRLGQMEELAAFVSVLLDGRSRFQTGQFFSYSGGWSP